MVCSCKSTSKKNTSDRGDLYQISYTGYNIKSEAEVCYPDENINCISRSDDQSKFLQECEDLGYQVFECACEHVLCGYNIAKESLGKSLSSTSKFTGYDFQGKKRSCLPMAKDVFCTLSVELADKFALECLNRGYESVQCACHDHLCSQRLNSF